MPRDVARSDDDYYSTMFDMMMMGCIVSVALIAIVPQLTGPRIQHMGSGVLAASGREQTLVEYADPSPFRVEGWINVSAMQAGDRVVVRRYVQLLQGGYELADEFAIEDKPAYPLVRVIPSAVMYGCRITLWQMSGTLREFPWEFYLSRG